MSTSINRKSVATALAAAVAAVAAPAMLLLGAGTAHANPAENNELHAWWDVIPQGLHAHVQNKTGQGSHCSYYSISGAMGKLPFLSPTYKHEFDLPPGGTADWVIGGVPTGQTWDTDITCPGVGNISHRGQY